MKKITLFAVLFTVFLTFPIFSQDTEESKKVFYTFEDFSTAVNKRVKEEIDKIKPILEKKVEDALEKERKALEEERKALKHNPEFMAEVAKKYIIIPSSFLFILVLFTATASIIKKHRKCKAEEKKRIEEQNKLEKLLAERFLEYLKISGGDKASAIAYFMEHKGEADYQTEYKAYLEAVKQYEG